MSWPAAGCYTGRMPHRRRLAAGLAGVVVSLTGCPAAPEPSAQPSPTPESAAPLPAYSGPPADAPPSAGPLTTVRAAVDLTPAIPGFFSRAEAAVAAPDGGAHVVVSPEWWPGSGQPPGPAQQLVTVAGPTGGFAVTRSVPVPELADVSSLHLLADGTVAVTGRIGRPADPRGGFGFHVVDPVTGTARTTVAVGYGRNATSAFGRSALGPDGRTLYLFATIAEDGATRERLVAVDTGTGTVLAERDVAPDVSAVSVAPAATQTAGLVPRPDGGVVLVFDATPDATRRERIPTLLTFDAALEPVGEAVGVTTLFEGAETQAVTGAADGTVFLLVELADTSWILAVPDAGGAGPVLVELADHFYDYAIAVEPAQVWALLPAFEGARAVDLTTGEIRGPVDVGCPRQDVRTIQPGGGGSTALLVGECDSPRTRTQMLWILGQ